MAQKKIRELCKVDFEAHTRIEIPYTLTQRSASEIMWSSWILHRIVLWVAINTRYQNSEDHKLSSPCRENLRILTHSCYNKVLSSSEHHCCDASRVGVIVPFDRHKRLYEACGLT